MKGLFDLQVENHCFRANCINGGVQSSNPDCQSEMQCASPQRREPHIHRLAGHKADVEFAVCFCF